MKFPESLKGKIKKFGERLLLATVIGFKILSPIKSDYRIEKPSIEYINQVADTMFKNLLQFGTEEYLAKVKVYLARFGFTETVNLENSTTSMYNALLEDITNDNRFTVKMLLSLIKLNGGLPLRVYFYRGITVSFYSVEAPVLLSGFGEFMPPNIILQNDAFYHLTNLAIRDIYQRKFILLQEREISELRKQNLVHELVHHYYYTLLSRFLELHGIEISLESKPGEPKINYQINSLSFVFQLIASSEEEAELAKDILAYLTVYKPETEPMHLWILARILQNKELAQETLAIFREINEVLSQSMSNLTQVRHVPSKFIYLDEFISYLFGYAYSDTEIALATLKEYYQKSGLENLWPKHKPVYVKILQNIFDLYVKERSPLSEESLKKVIR